MGSVSTISGSTLQGDEDGIGEESKFFEPAGLFITPLDGIGYVSDAASCHIRRISLISVVAPVISCSTVITSLIRPSGCNSYDQVRTYVCVCVCVSVCVCV